MLERLAERPREAVLAGLGAAVVALLAVNLYVARSPVDVSPVTDAGPAASRTPKSSTEPLKTPLDARPAASFPDTVTRPIFNAARKPVERQQVQAAAPGGPEELRLVGILQTGAGAKKALIRSGSEPKGAWIMEGAAVSGWTVKSIGQRSVIVMNGGRDYEIVLSRSASR